MAVLRRIYTHSLTRTTVSSAEDLQRGLCFRHRTFPECLRRRVVGALRTFVLTASAPALLKIIQVDREPLLVFDNTLIVATIQLDVLNSLIPQLFQHPLNLVSRFFIVLTPDII